MATDPDLGGAITPDHGRVPGYAYGASDEGLAAAEEIEGVARQHVIVAGGARQVQSSYPTTGTFAGLGSTQVPVVAPPTAEHTYTFNEGPVYLPADAKDVLAQTVAEVNAWQLASFQVDGVPVNVTPDDTVTVGDTTYTFVAALTAPDQVLVGSTSDESLANLAAAINAAPASQGIAYSTGTVANTNSAASAVDVIAHEILLSPVSQDAAVTVSESTSGARLTTTSNVAPDGTIIVLTLNVMSDETQLLVPPVWVNAYDQVGSTFDRSVQDESVASVAGTHDNAVYNFVGTVTEAGTDVVIPVYVTSPGVGIEADSGEVVTTSATSTDTSGAVTSIISTVTATDPTTGTQGTLTIVSTPTASTSTIVSTDPDTGQPVTTYTATGDPVGGGATVNLANAPEPVQILAGSALVLPGPMFPAYAAIYVGYVTSSDDPSVHPGWNVLFEFDSNQSSEIQTAADYYNNYADWLPSGLQDYSGFVGSVEHTNGDDSSTLVHVFTSLPGIGIHAGSDSSTDAPEAASASQFDPASLSFPTLNANGGWQPQAADSYLKPVTEAFDDTSITMPSALAKAVDTIVSLVSADGELSAYTGIAIPYLTADGSDGDPSTWKIADFGQTDAWAADLTGALTYGYGLTTDDVSDDDPQQMAVDMGLDPTVWGYLGKFNTGNTELFVYSTIPGFFGSADPASGAISVDNNPPAGADTGTWSYTALTGGGGTWTGNYTVDTTIGPHQPATGHAVFTDASGTPFDTDDFPADGSGNHNGFLYINRHDATGGDGVGNGLGGAIGGDEEGTATPTGEGNALTWSMGGFLLDGDTYFAQGGYFDGDGNIVTTTLSDNAATLYVIPISCVAPQPGVPLFAAGQPWNIHMVGGS